MKKLLILLVFSVMAVFAQNPASSSNQVNYNPSFTSNTRDVYSKLGDTISAKDFGAKGDGTTDDTTALQAFVTYVVANQKEGYIPAGTYNITAAINFSKQPCWKIRGAGPRVTIIRQFTNNVPIFNLGSDNVSLMHTFEISNLAFDYATSQPSTNTLANPIFFNDMAYEGVFRQLTFMGGSWAISEVSNAIMPWGNTWTDLVFDVGLTGGAMNFPTAINAIPNNHFGRLFVSAQNMVGPIFSFKGYNFVIDNIEVISANLGPQLIHIAAGSKVTIGALKLEIGTYTGNAMSLVQIDPNSFVSLNQFSIGGTTMVFTPSDGLSAIFKVNSGATLVLGTVDCDITSANANSYILNSSGIVTIQRLSMTGAGWLLANNGSSSSLETLTVLPWVNNQLSQDKGDANYTVALGDPNIISYGTAFTAPRTLTLPSSPTTGLHNGLYYQVVLKGAVNGANTLTVQSGATTLTTISTTSNLSVRFTWRRNPSNPSQGWIMTQYQTLP